jgi:hypothetical protein
VAEFRGRHNFPKQSSKSLRSNKSIARTCLHKHSDLKDSMSAAENNCDSAADIGACILLPSRRL